MALKNFDVAPLYAIDQEWAILTVVCRQKFNTMTISLGGLGTILGSKSPFLLVLLLHLMLDNILYYNNYNKNDCEENLFYFTEFTK